MRELVRKTVEDTLSVLREAEPDELIGVERNDRAAEWEMCRLGRYDWG